MLAKSKLNSLEVLISKELIDSNISHDEFVLINNVPKEYGNMKEENLKKFEDIISSSKSIYKTMLSYCLKCRKNTES